MNGWTVALLALIAVNALMALSWAASYFGRFLLIAAHLDQQHADECPTCGSTDRAIRRKVRWNNYTHQCGNPWHTP